MKIINRLKILPLYCLPKHFLTSIIYRLTRIEWGPWKNLLISSFIRIYKVDMVLALETNHRSFQSFNHFFTRELKPDARPVEGDDAVITCPVDGAVSQIGAIHGQSIIQAKGHDYQLHTLLAGDEGMISHFTDGTFATLYLSPRDYHRIHMPISGTLERMTYVPGELFPVNNASVSTVTSVFARNERVINFFTTQAGKVAVIMVGALFVGSMETVWAGQITPAKQRFLFTRDFAPGKVSLDKGQEMGRFNMGSTVILLFEPNKINWCERLQENSKIIMGEEIARLN